MNIKQSILKTFSNHNNSPLTTSKIVSELYQKEYETLKQQIKQELDQNKIKELKRKKAKLHRKALYHISLLEKEDVLINTGTKGKGEKIYKVSIQNNTKDYKIKSIITNIVSQEIENTDFQELEKYVQKKYIEQTTINSYKKLSAILISAKNVTLRKLQKQVEDLLFLVDDVVGIEDMEPLIGMSNTQELETFFQGIDKEVTYNEKKINIIIKLEKIELRELIKICQITKNKDIIINIITHNKEHGPQEKNALKHVLDTKNSLFQIQNGSAPTIIGDKGLYKIRKDYYEEYKKQQKQTCILYSSKNITINVENYLKDNKQAHEFREFILEIAKNLILQSTNQRKNTDILFNKINNLNKEVENKFYQSNTAYIRLKGLINIETQKELILSTREQLDDFCMQSETIYKSCGLPTTIKVKIANEDIYKEINQKFLEDSQIISTTLLQQTLTNPNQIQQILTQTPHFLNINKKQNTLTQYLWQQLWIYGKRT